MNKSRYIRKILTRSYLLGLSKLYKNLLRLILCVLCSSCSAKSNINAAEPTPTPAPVDNQSSPSVKKQNQNETCDNNEKLSGCYKFSEIENNNADENRKNDKNESKKNNPKNKDKKNLNPPKPIDPNRKMHKNEVKESNPKKDPSGPIGPNPKIDDQGDKPVDVSDSEESKSNSLKKTNKGSRDKTIFIKCLADAYKPTISPGSDGNSIRFSDGTTMKFDDGHSLNVERDFDKILEDTKDISQMFLIPYTPLSYTKPKVNEDPGRIRFQEFQLKLYGLSLSHNDLNDNQLEKELRGRIKLEQVDWSFTIDKKTISQKISFSPMYGAAEALREVIKELRILVEKKPEYIKYLKPPLGGTFAPRNIRGTNRLSNHAYATAIDLNTSNTDYWRNNIKAFANQSPRTIPKEIVEIFERHNFIWGGKWYHFDTMHFEYRPELLACKGLYYIQ
jgi:hypothetical protein